MKCVECVQIMSSFIVHKCTYKNDTKILEVKLFAFAYRLFRLHVCPVEWGEISTKQSVGKCKQINF